MAEIRIAGHLHAAKAVGRDEGLLSPHALGVSRYQSLLQAHIATSRNPTRRGKTRKAGHQLQQCRAGPQSDTLSGAFAAKQEGTPSDLPVLRSWEGQLHQYTREAGRADSTSTLGLTLTCLRYLTPVQRGWEGRLHQHTWPDLDLPAARAAKLGGTPPQHTRPGSDLPAAPDPPMQRSWEGHL